jgi:hypothetical protein
MAKVSSYKTDSGAGYKRRSVWREAAVIFIVAVLFNYLWELAQAPLYVGMTSFGVVWWHCFIASLGDGILVLLIYAVGWIALGKRDWYAQPGVRGYVLMLITGLMIGVGIETLAVSVSRQWTYTEKMPLVSGLGIGLAPLAQMILLPPVIFRAAAWWGLQQAEGGND